MKGKFKRGTALVLVVILTAMPFDLGEITQCTGTSLRKINAAETSYEGSLATKVTGTWSYWDGNKDVVQTNVLCGQCQWNVRYKTDNCFRRGYIHKHIVYESAGKWRLV